MTKKESVEAAQKLAAGLSGEWKVKTYRLFSSDPSDVSYVSHITNGIVYILQHDPKKKDYTAAFEGMNYEIESWSGRTPAEALGRLVRDHSRRVKDLIIHISFLEKLLPEMKAKQIELEALLPAKKPKPRYR